MLTVRNAIGICVKWVRKKLSNTHTQHVRKSTQMVNNLSTQCLSILYRCCTIKLRHELVQMAFTCDIWELKRHFMNKTHRLTDSLLMLTVICHRWQCLKIKLAEIISSKRIFRIFVCSISHSHPSLLAWFGLCGAKLYHNPNIAIVRSNGPHLKVWLLRCDKKSIYFKFLLCCGCWRLILRLFVELCCQHVLLKCFLSHSNVRLSSEF